MGGCLSKENNNSNIYHQTSIAQTSKKQIPSPNPLPQQNNNRQLIKPDLIILPKQSNNENQSSNRCIAQPKQIKIKMYDTIEELIKSICDQISNNQTYNQLLNRELVLQMLQEFDKGYVSLSNTINIVKLVFQYMEMSKNSQFLSNLKNEKNLVVWLQKFSSKWMKLKNQIYFINRDALKILDFLDKEKRKPRQNQINRCYFKYEFHMNQMEAKIVADLAKILCSIDLRAFSFLSNYLWISCVNLQNKGLNIKKIQKKLVQTLRKLKQQNPPAPALHPKMENLGIHKFKESDPNVIPKKYLQLKSIPNQQRVKVLQKFIEDRAKQAKNNFDTFNQIVKQICMQQGYHFRSGVKLQNMSKRKAVERIKQKMLNKQFQIYSFDKAFDNNNKLTLKEYTTAEFENYLKEIQGLYDKIEGPIQFKVSDMVRGKCMFSDHHKINQCASKLIAQIEKRQKQGQQIRLLQIDNRFLKGTSDLVFKILIKQSIAELQLVIDMNVVANEFNHKIYQLERSVFFTPLTMLKQFNEQLSFEYFSQINQIIKANVNAKAKQNYQQKITFQQAQIYFKQLLKMIPGQFQSKIQQKQTRINKQKLDILSEQFFIISKQISPNAANKQAFNLRNAVFCFQMNNYQKSQDYLQKFKIGLQDVINVEQFRVKSRNQLNELQLHLAQIYAKTCFMRGVIFKQKGKYVSALQTLAESMNIFKNILNNNQQTIACLEQITHIFRKTNKQLEAIQKYQQILIMKEQIHGKDSYSSAQTYNSLGLAYMSIGRRQQAIKQYKQSLFIRQQFGQTDSLKCADILNNMGYVYRDWCKFQDAIKYYELSLDMKQHLMGKDSLQCAQTLHNIATVYKQNRDFQQALQMFQRALDIRQKIKGQVSLQCAETYYQMASTHKHYNQNKKAKFFYKLSISIYEELNVKYFEYGRANKKLGDMMMIEMLKPPKKKNQNYYVIIQCMKKAYPIYRQYIRAMGRGQYYLCLTTIADCYQKLGDTVKQREYADMYQKTDPNLDEIQNGQTQQEIH